MQENKNSISKQVEGENNTALDRYKGI